MTKIFVISDNKNVVYGIAPSLTQARCQACWFLPKGIEYFIRVDWIC